MGVCAKCVSRRGSGWLVARGVELCSPNRDDPIPNPSIRSGKEWAQRRASVDADFAVHVVEWTCPS